MRALLNSPQAAARLSDLAVYLRFRSKLEPAVRELAILTVAREIDCQYVWTAHEPLARRAGITDATILSIRDRRAPDGLLPEEAVVVQYAQQLLRSHVATEEVFQAVLRQLEAQGVVDVTTIIGYYIMFGLAILALQVELEPGVTPLLPIPNAQ